MYVIDDNQGGKTFRDSESGDSVYEIRAGLSLDGPATRGTSVKSRDSSWPALRTGILFSDVPTSTKV